MGQYASLIGAAGGGTIGMVAGILSAIQQNKQLKYEQKQTEKAGLIAAANRRAEARRLASAQRAGIAGAGVEESGTALDVLATTAAEEELSALRVRYGFERRANQLKDQALNALIAGGVSSATLSAASFGKAADIYAGNNADQPTTIGRTYTYGKPVTKYPTGYGIRSQTYQPAMRTSRNTYTF